MAGARGRQASRLRPPRLSCSDTGRDVRYLMLENDNVDRTMRYLHTDSIAPWENGVMTKQHIHIAALVAILVGGSWAIAAAQSASPTSTAPSMGSTHSGESDPMMSRSHGQSMHGMNSSMMGNDPLKMCSQMMAAVSRDPKLHREMSRAMEEGMSKAHSA